MAVTRPLAALVVMSVFLSARATAQVAADMPSEHWWAGFDVGWAGEYDDSGLWKSGYAVGVSGYYSLSTILLVGGRFGVSHWDYDPGSVERGLVPPGDSFVEALSSGQTEILEFGAFVRVERPALLPAEFGLFGHVSAQAGYVKHFALSEVVYDDSVGGLEVAYFELNESDWRLCLLVAAGFGRPFTSQSIIEVFPWYRFIYEDGGAVAVPGISLGLRLRV